MIVMGFLARICLVTVAMALLAIAAAVPVLAQVVDRP
jgi:hypothetical protein